MPKWTVEQQEAIDKDGTNIIVSAGAGSGKTAVLTQRVIRKLKDGIFVNHLLVLTFTDAAAGEMKERIRKAIKKEDSLKDQLAFLDSSYITTFDSFALSVVKKYSYVFNMGRDISIIDSSIINILRHDFLDAIFEEEYAKRDEKFVKLISDFCVKDDKEIKDAILSVNSSLDLKSDKEGFLNTYIDNFYSDDFINNASLAYTKLLVNKISEIRDLLDIIFSKEDSKIVEKFSVLDNLLSSNSYDEIKKNVCKISNIRVKDSKEEKDKVSDLLKEISSLTIYDSLDDMISIYKSTKDYIDVIISIVNKLDAKINDYKRSNNSFEFNDISKMAIKIVRDYPEIRDELKYFYNEIMVDEYQDTSDLQEDFIKEIANNNVYMVGDVKQSIYRFRNANPLIFKNKYDSYSHGMDGYKIDLVKNFRSRKEVLNNINVIFNKIMDNYIGGADYISSHQMVFGNDTYINEGLTDQNNNLEIYNYKLEDKTYKKEEVEIFIIANDIKKKVEDKYIVFDKDKLIKRPINYSDFCIILDRGTDFPLYQKIFEYVGIPLNVYKDEDLTASYDIIIIKNILKLIIKIKKSEFDQEFKFLYTSIARSFLFEIKDDVIFNCFIDNSFYKTEIFMKAKNIANIIDEVSLEVLIFNIISDFDFINKAMRNTDIEKTIIRVDYLQKIASNLDSLSYTPYDFSDYLEKMITSSDEIRYKLGTSSALSVDLMNIHKSKGLEFPICYYAGLYKSFNTSDIKSRFLFDNKYGIITPFFKEGLMDIFTKELVKENYMIDEISEKIRLFYVALTRAKEKMIMVTSLDDSYNINDKVVSDNIRIKYKSFLDILNSIKEEVSNNIVDIDINNIPISKDYNMIKKFNYKDYINDSNVTIDKRKVLINKDILTNEHFSKSVNKIISVNEEKNMKFGTKMHYIFEMCDFNNLDNLDPFYKSKVSAFLKNDVMKKYKDAKIYKEYEFSYIDDGKTYNGIIDLMLCYDDYIDIIDYKLNDISDPLYLKQLGGYKNYISKISDKPINIYLYSITEEKFKKLNL